MLDFAVVCVVVLHSIEGSIVPDLPDEVCVHRCSVHSRVGYCVVHLIVRALCSVGNIDAVDICCDACGCGCCVRLWCGRYSRCCIYSVSIAVECVGHEVSLCDYGEWG